MVHLPGVLQSHAGERSAVEVPISCGTVGDAMAAVREQWPGVTDRVLTEAGAVREHVHLFVGEDNINVLAGLATPIRAGDEIQIIHAVSGG